MTIAAGIGLGKAKPADTDVVLGEDWVAPEGAIENELREGRAKRGVISLNSSPLARKIITFNLIAMIIMVAGVLYLNPFRDSLVLQREGAIAAEAQLIADVFEARMPKEAPVNLAVADGLALDQERLAVDLDPTGRG